MNANSRQSTVQDVAKGPRLVAAMDCLRLRQLSVDEGDEPGLVEPLSGLLSLLVRLPDHNNETGM